MSQNETALQKKETKSPALMTSKGIQLRTVDDLKALANMYVNSGMVPKDDIGKPDKVAVKIEFGISLGLTPFAAIRGIAVINGMPCMWGDPMVGLCISSGHMEDMKIEEIGEGGSRGYKVTIKRKGMSAPFISTFAIADARQAGLYPCQDKRLPWAKYPHRMCLNRARSFALRDAFPDVLQGLVTREEAMDMAIDADFTVETPKTAKEIVEEKLIEEKPKPDTKTKKKKEEKPEEGDFRVVDVNIKPQIEPLGDPEKGGIFDDLPHQEEPPKTKYNHAGDPQLPF